jgi:hypothetical protein
MKIYLDINETILGSKLEKSEKGTEYTRGPANYLKEFLKHALDNHDVYWLSTQCNGDAEVTVRYLQRYFDQELIELVSKIKPTSWNIYKLQAVNLDDDFLWFDDYITQPEEELLEQAGKTHCHIKVNLDEDPDIFMEFLDI